MAALVNPEPGTDVKSVGPRPASVEANLPERPIATWALPCLSSRSKAVFSNQAKRGRPRRRLGV